MNREVFMKEYRVGGKHYDSIRYQVENLLIGYGIQGNIFEREIIFHSTLVDGKPFTVTIDKATFFNHDIKIWRKIDSFKQSDLDAKILNRQTIAERAKTLEEIIKGNGMKVRIFTGLNIDNSYGSQYMILDKKYAYYNYLPRDPSTGIPYFNIDFTKNVEHARSQLRYIASLMTTYIPAYSGGSPNNFIFVMKSATDTISSKDMICAFDSSNIHFSPHIHSPNDYILKTHDYSFSSIDIHTVSNLIPKKEMIEFNQEWIRGYISINANEFFKVYSLLPSFNDIKNNF